MADHNFQNVRYTTFAGQQSGSHLLILAGVHGDEFEPMAAARNLIKVVPEVLQRGKVTVVPIVNVSAFRLASRTGEDGVDLARTCPGNRNGTVTEVTAAEVSELIAGADYLIDMHGGGNAFVIDPLAGYVLHDSAEILEKQRGMARAFNLKTVWGTSSKLNGRTLSVARDHNVPAIYTEFGGGGGFRKVIVEEYVQGCLNVMRSLGMSDGVLAEKKYFFELEDYREDSGYLQIMLPAAEDGFFEPTVSLGDIVQNNQPIGTISDPFGDHSIPVHADQDGMVFMLRAIPSVKKGDTLGGILPVVKPGNFKIL